MNLSSISFKTYKKSAENSNLINWFLSFPVGLLFGGRGTFLNDKGPYTNHVATKGGRGFLKKPQHYITAI